MSQLITCSILISKDYNSGYARGIIEESKTYMKIDEEIFPCHIIPVHESVIEGISVASKNLLRDDFGHKLVCELETRTIHHVVSTETNSISSAISYVRNALGRLNHCLYKGEVFMKEPRGNKDYIKLSKSPLNN